MAVRFIDATDVNFAWAELIANLLSSPVVCSRDGQCREVTGAHVILDGSLEHVLFNPRRNMSMAYACAELLWYLAGERKIARVKAYAPSYEKFADPASGEAYGAYGYRVRRQYGDLISAVVQMIERSSYTRQAVVPIFQPMDTLRALEGDCPDIPCTLTWQFLLRNEKLQMHVSMRSNDVWLGFPYDVWAFTTIQKLVAGALGVDAGEYHHVAASMHLYERNEEAAHESQRYPFDIIAPRVNRYTVTRGDVANVIEAEDAMRFNEGQVGVPVGLPPILRDMLMCCASKFNPVQSYEIASLALRAGLEMNQR